MENATIAAEVQAGTIRDMLARLDSAVSRLERAPQDLNNAFSPVCHAAPAPAGELNTGKRVSLGECHIASDIEVLVDRMHAALCQIECLASRSRV